MFAPVVPCQYFTLISLLVVELLRTQVRFHGVELPGYIIISAAKASLVQCVCQPLWCRRELKSKTTYLASVDCMQVTPWVADYIINHVHRFCHSLAVVYL